MATIKQWVTNFQGLDVIKQTDAPMPSPGKGEVLVEVHSVSLNYRDTEGRSLASLDTASANETVAMGQYTHHKSVNEAGESSVVPCSDMCGRVTRVGDDVTAWKTGDRVLSTFCPDHLTGQITPDILASSLGLPVDGVLTTHRVFPEHALVKAPEYLSDDEACTLPIASVTAWMSVNGMLPMGQTREKDEYVLLQGTGGVAIAGLQIAKASGAKVIITSSSDSKLQQATSLGADHTINYRSNPQWADSVMSFTNSHGADIILETGGADTLNQSFDCIAFGGLINCIGYTSGKMDAHNDRTNMNLLVLRRTVTVKGIMNGPRDRFEEMVRFYENYQIRPVVNRVFGFDEAKDAFKLLSEGGHFGKIVIRVKD